MLHTPTEQVTMFSSQILMSRRNCKILLKRYQNNHHLSCCFFFVRFTQIVATVKNKMHEIQDVVSIAANGSVDCVHMAVTWLMGRIQEADDQADQPLLERAISVASTGLDSALIMSEALMDRMLPPAEEDKGL